MRSYEDAVSVMNFLEWLGLDAAALSQAISDENFERTRAVIKDNPKITKEEFLRFMGIEEYVPRKKGSKIAEVVLEYHKKIQKDVVAFLGEECIQTEEAEDRDPKKFLRARVTVAVDEDFIGWCCGYSEFLVVISPKFVINRIKRVGKNIDNLYFEEDAEIVRTMPKKIRDCGIACFNTVSKSREQIGKKSMLGGRVPVIYTRHTYLGVRNRFLREFELNMSWNFASEGVCLACAKWLAENGVGRDAFKSLLEVIRYECGSKEENVLIFLENLTKEDLIEKHDALLDAFYSGETSRW